MELLNVEHPLSPTVIGPRNPKWAPPPPPTVKRVTCGVVSHLISLTTASNDLIDGYQVLLPVLRTNNLRGGSPNLDPCSSLNDSTPNSCRQVNLIRIRGGCHVGDLETVSSTTDCCTRSTPCQARSIPNGTSTNSSSNSSSHAGWWY